MFKLIKYHLFGFFVTGLYLVAVASHGQERLASAETIENQISAKYGYYANRIIEFSPPTAYTEICIKDGNVLSDVHIAGESTAGGSCEPGDIGWVMEQSERPALNWEQARMRCLRQEMRLPEVFEYAYACDNAEALALDGMVGNWEWASNQPEFIYIFRDSAADTVGETVSVIGNSSCGSIDTGWVGRNDSFASSYFYRCAR